MSIAEIRIPQILYQDQSLLVVNKPTDGVVHHPSASPGVLIDYLKQNNHLLADHPTRPGVVHRLDRHTTGVLVLAKTSEALTALQTQLKNRTMGRGYLALVYGRITPLAGKIQAPIAPLHTKHSRRRFFVQPLTGRPATTIYRVLAQNENFSLLELSLNTGRTHQIRVHLQKIGYPIVGDPVYGRLLTPQDSGQYLHAGKLTLLHPMTHQKLKITAPISQRFTRLLKKIKLNNDQSFFKMIK